MRLFVGTEHAQYRAERVFVWSIEQVRDHDRRYEIYLLKDLPGFDRSRWLTGFTNYRFLIPHLAQREGRAIYNDIDQIYLADPAELFDLDMGGFGFLSINERDTSVMLIDCARMGDVWTPELTRRERRKAIEARATGTPGLWGPMPGEWNARDLEYESGRSKLVHFTTIHTQPWMPFPQRFVYQRNPVGHLWHALEHSADAAGFELFTAAQPSAQYQALVERLRAEGSRPDAASPAEIADCAESLARARAGSVLELGWGTLDPGAAADSWVDGRGVVRHDPAIAALAKRPLETFDAVVCRGGLDRLDDEDVPWAVEQLFSFGRRLVYVWLAPESREVPVEAWRAGVPRDRFWWSQHFEAAGARHPDVQWRLVSHVGSGSERRIDWMRERARRGDGGPRVWVLDDDKAGHRVQSLGLAEALGWPYEVRALRFNLLNRLSNHLLGASRLGVAGGRSDPLEPPWPDLVISTGRRLAPVARWIAASSRGHTRVVQLGRKGGDIVEPVDLAVTCEHFRLLPHRRRIETVVPLNAISDERLAEAARRWRELCPDPSRPPVALLVGGSSARHRLDEGTARAMGRNVAAFAAAAGRAVVAITSPRTTTAVCDALAAELAPGSKLYRWRAKDPANPYLGALALASVIVATGDSESMLGEAAAAGKPLYIYPLPERARRLRDRLAEWVIARAHSRPRKRRKGSVRPQQRLEALFARLLAAGWVRIPRDLDALHAALIRSGVARPFGAPWTETPPPPLHEVDEVARRVRALLGFPEAWPLAAPRSEPPARRLEAIRVALEGASAAGDAG